MPEAWLWTNDAPLTVAMRACAGSRVGERLRWSTAPANGRVSVVRGAGGVISPLIVGANQRSWSGPW
jgi:hypothetical protein